MNDQKLAIENFDKALTYVDRLLPILPTYSHFNISSIVISSNWTETEKEEAYNLDTFIETLLVDKLHYADEQNGRFWLELNEKGRTAQSWGGHFLYYQKQKKDSELAELKQRIDLKNAQRIYKWYWLPLVISIISFLLALGKIIFDNYTKK